MNHLCRVKKGNYKVVNIHFIQLLEECIKKYNVKNVSYNKALKSFCRFLVFTYASQHLRKDINEYCLSKKDIERLKYPERGSHSKHSFYTIQLMRLFLMSSENTNIDNNFIPLQKAHDTFTLIYTYLTNLPNGSLNIHQTWNLYLSSYYVDTAIHPIYK